MLKFILAAFLSLGTAAHADSLIVPPSQVGVAKPGQIPGTTTNDDACAGCVGEVISSTVPLGSGVSLTTDTAATVTTIELTAGDWDVTGVNYYLPGTTTNVTNLMTSISLSTSLATGAGSASYWFTGAGVVFGNGSYNSQASPVVRVKVANGTTQVVYLLAYAKFTVSTLTAAGSLRARRVR